MSRLNLKSNHKNMKKNQNNKSSYGIEAFAKK